MKAIVKKKTETFLHNNEAFAVQINNKKGERSDLIFLSEGRETILELFTVRIFVGSSQNAAGGPFFFFFGIFVAILLCCYFRMNIQRIADQMIASTKKSFLWDMCCTCIFIPV